MVLNDISISLSYRSALSLRFEIVAVNGWYHHKAQTNEDIDSHHEINLASN